MISSFIDASKYASSDQEKYICNYTLSLSYFNNVCLYLYASRMIINQL